MAAPKSIPWPTTADFPPGVWLAETRKPPASPYPLHHHRVAEITWIQGGAGRLWVGGKTHPLAEGDLFAMAPGMAHQILPDPSSPIHRYTLFFQMRNLPPTFQMDFKAFAESSGTVGPSHASIDHPFLAKPFRALLTCQSGAPGEGPIRIGSLCLVLSHIFSLRSSLPTPHENPNLKRLGDWLADPRSRIEDPDGADRGARALGLSVRQWNRLFRRLHGTSYKQWQLRRRLNQVDQRMAEGASAVRAAEMAGFETIPHFFRIYRKYRGHPPGRFGVA